MGNPSTRQDGSGDFRINLVPRRKNHRSKFPHRRQMQRHQHGLEGLEGRCEVSTTKGGVKGRAELCGDQGIRRHVHVHGMAQSGQITGGVRRPGRCGRRMMRQALRRPIHRQALRRLRILGFGIVGTRCPSIVSLNGTRCPRIVSLHGKKMDGHRVFGVIGGPGHRARMNRKKWD